MTRYAKQASLWLLLVVILSGAVIFAAYKGPSFANPSSDATPPPDVSYTPNLARGVSFIKSDPSSYKASPSSTDQVLIDGLPKANTLNDLESMVTDNTTTVVIDKETLPTIPSDVLQRFLKQGVSIIGLDVPLTTLAEATNLDAVINEGVSHRRDVGLDGVDSNPTAPFYSYVVITPNTAPFFRFDIGQKEFGDNLFASDLARHLNGANSDIGVKKQ